MKKWLALLVSSALLTGYAQTNSRNASGSSAPGSNSTGSQTSSSASQSSAGAATNQVSFDQVFLRRATLDSLLEVQLGEIAQTNSQNGIVQEFGVLLATDHTNALLQAQQLADELGISLPTALNPLQQEQVQLLSTLTGTAFDRAFIAFMIRSHVSDVRLFSAAASQATNPEVQAFSLDQLPVLIEHLLTALGIRDDLRANQGTSTGP